MMKGLGPMAGLAKRKGKKGKKGKKGGRVTAEGRAHPKAKGGPPTAAQARVQAARA